MKSKLIISIMSFILAASFLCSCVNTNFSIAETTQSDAKTSVTTDIQTTQIVQTTNAPQTPEPQISIDLADEQHDCEVCNAIEKMTFEEFNVFIAGYEYLERKNIYFWKDENGRNHVADLPFNSTKEKKAMCFEDKEVKYSKGSVTDDIIQDITIFDLVKNFGIPRAVPFTGMFCLDFISDNGIEYRFVDNLGDKKWSVLEGDLPTTKQIEGSELMFYINVADEQHDCEVCNAIEKMTQDEIYALEDKYDGLSRGSYFFWKDENGRNCVVYSSSDRSRAVKAMCFEDEEVKYGKGVITTDMLYGMTVFDIVKNFGVPVEIPKKSSSVVMYFASDDALTYRIAFANFFEYHMAWGVTEVEQQAE